MNFDKLFQEQQELEDTFLLDYIPVDRSEDSELFKEANNVLKKLKARRKILISFKRMMNKIDGVPECAGLLASTRRLL